jgi:hypothetical protein
VCWNEVDSRSSVDDVDSVDNALEAELLRSRVMLACQSDPYAALARKESFGDIRLPLLY